VRLPKEVREAFARQGSIGGKIGGKATTPAKVKAARKNGAAPVKEGSKPRGRPRKEKA